MVVAMMKKEAENNERLGSDSPSSPILACSSAAVSNRGFPGGPVVKNLPCNAGDIYGFNPGLGNKDTTCLRTTEPAGSRATKDPA